MFEFLGPLLSAGTKLIGGLLGKSSADKAAADQRAMNAYNQSMQWDTFRHARSYAAADAMEASRDYGISPLTLLGVNSSSPSPISVGNTAGGGAALGSAISDMGQDIGRAVSSYGTREERQLQLTGAKLDLERKQLENETLKMGLASKMARLAAPGTAPPQPSLETKYGGDPTIKTEKDTRQDLLPFGLRWKTLNMPDSQAVENRYGDPVEWAYGMGLLAGDAAMNAQHIVAPYVKRWYKSVTTPDLWSKWYVDHGYYTGY